MHQNYDPTQDVVDDVERPDTEDVGQSNAIDNASESAVVDTADESRTRESDTDTRPADTESEARGFAFDE